MKVSKCLRQNQGIFAKVTYLGVTSSKENTYNVPNGTCQFYGLRIGATRWDRKKRACNLLSKKEIHWLWIWYSLLEKICCVIVWVARCLRQYMVCHTTLSISRMDPIKYIWKNPEVTGRIARWQVLLTEYDIQYVTQKAIKRSVLEDHSFINRCKIINLCSLTLLTKLWWLSGIVRPQVPMRDPNRDHGVNLGLMVL